MSPVDDRRELLFPYHVLTITDYGVDLRKKKGIMLPQTRTTANALLDILTPQILLCILTE